MTSPSSGGETDDFQAAERAALAVESAWSAGGSPDLEALWDAAGRRPGALPSLLKADLRCRFARGQRPEVAEYLVRFPILRDLRDRVVSLVYEEYCLREEQGETPDPQGFCDRYEPWRDSLEAQLRFHRLLSQAAGAMPRRPRFPEPGSRFVHFRLDQILGTGGEGQVYLAREEALGNRRVALKVTLDRGREPAVMGRLEHPRIVSVLSVTRDEPTGLRGLCMPYRPALPLHEVIKRARPQECPRSAETLWNAAAPDAPFDPEDRPGWAGFPREGTYAQGVAWVVMTLAHALAYAHAQGVLHRDVKPGNVLLTARDGPQLLDFNLAHDPQAAAEDAQAARAGGTLPYMAPEQLEAFLDPAKHVEVGEAADLYALGLVLVEMLTGRQPEGPASEMPLPRAIAELRDQRLVGPIVSVRARNPSVPHALEAIAGCCLAPRPNDRYTSASELAKDLALFLDHRPPQRVQNPSRPERLGNYGRRNRVALASALFLGTVGLASAITLARRGDPAPTPVLGPSARLIERALKHEAQGEFQAARRAFAEADHVEPSALSAYRQAAHAHPDSASVQAGLGLALLKALHGEEASLAFRKAVDAPHPASDEGRLVAWLGLAVRNEASGRIPEAEALYDRAMKAFHDRRDPVAAAEMIRRVADVRGFVDSSPRLQTLLGSVLLDQGNRFDAREVLVKARQLAGRSGYYPLHQNLASLTFLNRNYEDACREMSAAIEVARARQPRVSPSDLAGLYFGRADYRIHWADALRNRDQPTTAETEQARRQYEGAREDIHLARELGGDVPGRASKGRPTIDALDAQVGQGLKFLDEQSRIDHVKSMTPPRNRGIES